MVNLKHVVIYFTLIIKYIGCHASCDLENNLKLLKNKIQ